MKKISFSLLLVLSLLLAACGKEQSYEPVEIDPEVDVCEVCNMSIVNVGYATQLISKEGDVYNFDDIGCMVEYIYKDKEIAEKDIAKQYVRDLETEEWVEAKDATFVYDEEFWTPMANGVVTFDSNERAEEYVEEHGKGIIYSYEQLLDEHKWGWEE